MRGEHKRTATPVMGAAKTINEYQLGDSIGKGAFGTVYQGLNMKTGEVVAIKQITLQNIPKSELDAMMVEIDLLKKLHHNNIVRYIGFVKSKDYLNIILEYCENGSLQSICKKFGKFPETLMAVYTAQVLEGLVYLHQEGVIHRDIKGANILTTKEGHVKLADFGVATHATDIGADHAVVGSPYWMAPEVIEMTGGTTASDIWSVGSTIIELMTGEPPYFDLSPMSALFRIVQDDHPPLPDGISPALHDFFMQCFQKDCNLRVSAAKLLKHQWLQKARKERMQQNAEKPTDQRAATTNFIDTVQTIVQWNEALQGDNTAGKTGTIKNLKPATPAKVAVGRKNSQPISLSPAAASPSSLPSLALAKPGETGRFAPLKQQLSEMADEDNWDADFEDKPGGDTPKRKTGDTPSKDAKRPQSGAAANANVSRTPSKTRPDLAAFREDDDDDDMVSGLDVGSSSRPIQVRQALVPPKAARPSSPAAQGKQDLWAYSEKGESFDDLGGGGGELRLNPKLNRASSNKGTLTPKLIRPEDLQKFVAAAQTAAAAPSNGAALRSPSPGLGAPSLAPPSPSKLLETPVSTPRAGGRAGQRVASGDMIIYREDDKEQDDYSEVFGLRFTGDQKGATFKLRLAVPTVDDGDDDTAFKDDLAEGDEDEDVFATVDDFDDIDLEEQREKNRLAAQVTDLLRIVGAIHRGSPDDAVVSAADRLVALLQENALLREELMLSRNGLVPLLDLLDDVAPTSTVVTHLLRLVWEIVNNDTEALEWFVSIGGLASLVRFAGAGECALEARLQALRLLKTVATSSLKTLQAFVACRGIPVLIQVLADGDYDAHAALVRLAFECVAGSLDVAELVGANGGGDGGLTKTQLYVLYASAGLLPAVAHAFHEVLMDPSSDADLELPERMVDLFMAFAGMISVRAWLASRPLLKALVRDLYCLPPSLQLKVLKVLRDVSMLSATSLELLQKVDAIMVLVGLLDRQEGPFAQEIRTLDVFILFNLCRVYKPRQEAAAVAGIVPHLKHFTSIKSQMKEFALQLLADMADASAKTREILWQNNMVTFFVNLLASNSTFIQHVALQALADWLGPETAKVEGVMIQPENIKTIISGLSLGKFVHATAMGNPLDSLYKIIMVSQAINQALGQSSLVRVLTDKLSNPDVMVRLTLLKILTALYSQHPQPAQLVQAHPKLRAAVERIAESDGRVLVSEIARKLRDEFASAAR